MRGLGAGRDGRYLRPDLGLQLSADRHHRHGGRRTRPAVRHADRSPCRRDGPGAGRRLHQFELRAGLRIRGARAARPLPAERPVRLPGGAGMSAYWITVLTQTCIFAIMGLGLNVVWGWAGDFDLAFYAYVALGAYLTIVLTLGKPLPPIHYILASTLP